MHNVNFGNHEPGVRRSELVTVEQEPWEPITFESLQDRVKLLHDDVELLLNKYTQYPTHVLQELIFSLSKELRVLKDSTKNWPNLDQEECMKLVSSAEAKIATLSNVVLSRQSDLDLELNELMISGNYNKSIDSVCALLEQGANPNAFHRERKLRLQGGELSMGALHLALMRGNNTTSDIIRLLLEHRTDLVFDPTSKGFNPLKYVIRGNKNPAADPIHDAGVIKLLLDHWDSYSRSTAFTSPI